MPDPLLWPTRSLGRPGSRGDLNDRLARLGDYTSQYATLASYGEGTNDVLDFQPIHNQMLAAGEEHYGLIFTADSTMPRNKASIPLWVKALEKVLTEHAANDALKNRVRHLS
jgi:hypothetical protein